MTHLFQNIFIAFALIGFGHTLILVIYNIGKENRREINIKYELAFILFLLFIFSIYTLTGNL
jgi:hypothetical protein